MVVSLKIKISYTNNKELTLVLRHLAPLDLRFKRPKTTPKGPFKCAYLTSRNDEKADKKALNLIIPPLKRLHICEMIN